MKLSLPYAVIAAISLVVAATPAQLTAQTTQIASGNIVTLTNEGPRTFSFNAVKLPNGKIVGGGHLNNRTFGASIAFELSSMFIDANGNLFLAGIATNATGNPPPGTLNNSCFFVISKVGSKIASFYTGGNPIWDAEFIATNFGTPPPQAFVVPDAGQIKRRI